MREYICTHIYQGMYELYVKYKYAWATPCSMLIFFISVYNDTVDRDQHFC